MLYYAPARRRTARRPPPGQGLLRLVALQSAVCLAVVCTAYFGAVTGAWWSGPLRDQAAAWWQARIDARAVMAWAQSQWGRLEEWQQLAEALAAWQPPAAEVGSGGLFPVPAGEGMPRPAPGGAQLAPAVFTAPLSLPVGGLVSSPFGYRIHPVTGQLDFHKGVDIAAAEGTEIHAVWPGRVVETGYSPIDGNYLVLEHSATLSSRYCHCSQLIAQVGDWLPAGARIALVGQTGIATGAHLHLELLAGQQVIDPLPSLLEAAALVQGQVAG